MIRVADYIAKKLVDYGVRHIFMVVGGGAMHLNDAFSRSRDLRYICNHHEQACAMAAEGYARVTGTIGVACVTSGPGGTNALTGLLGQWLDSIPALYISGQVRYDTTVASTGLPLRQLGDQESNIVAIVKPITKYAVMVTDPQMIRHHLEKAVYVARAGRPGPVWLDIPLNVQATLVEENKLARYDPADDRVEFDQHKIEQQVAHIIQRLKAAERPVILGGSGIRLAGAYEQFQAMIKKMGIPVLTAWNAIDLLSSDHPLFFGRPGPLGQRGANFILQNANLLLSIGCRMSIARQLGYEFTSFARAAYKIMVNIDPVEMQKQAFRPDLPIHCDAGLFLEILAEQLEHEKISGKFDWIRWCQVRKDRYPVVLPEQRKEKENVNPYFFSEVLSDHLEANDVIVSSDGASCVVPIQALRIKKGQRHIVNSGCAAMGFGLPSAIGACFAHNKCRIICLEGDGSIQLNIQELQTVVHHQLPLKIFIFNNNGYLSIRTTQNSFFDGHLVGESPSSGVSFPDMVKIAEAYGIYSVRIHNHSEIVDTIRAALQTPGPVLCDVRMSPDQTFAPRVSSQRLPDGRMVSKPLEDMYPFLDRDEFLSNMLIPAWEP